MASFFDFPILRSFIFCVWELCLTLPYFDPFFILIYVIYLVSRQISRRSTFQKPKDAFFPILLYERFPFIYAFRFFCFPAFLLDISFTLGTLSTPLFISYYLFTSFIYTISTKVACLGAVFKGKNSRHFSLLSMALLQSGTGKDNPIFGTQ